MPQVSIITPTINRQDFLPALWRCVQAQSIHDIEWLVHDGSPDPAPMFDQIQDQRISYVHAPGEMSIGAKRNALCDVARSEIIAHFDDDDFYAPHYLEGMLSSMNEQKVDFIKLFGFFLYCRGHNVFAYWDLEIGFPIHFRLHPTEPPTLIPYRGGVSARWGYGFSYVFYRQVWEAIHFPDQYHGEDQVFADNAVANFKSGGKQDCDRSCLHVIHSGNTSMVFPQQILPLENLPQLFPRFPR
jgi:glycosyltransferase involved in cell wall biosynthesis